MFAKMKQFAFIMSRVLAKSHPVFPRINNAVISIFACFREWSICILHNLVMERSKTAGIIF